jgi:serine/threonine protein kinase
MLDSVLKITVSLLNGIHYLHDENTFHGEIRTENILVDGSYHLKLVEKALLSPSEWEVVVAQGMGLRVLRGRGVLLSPCILDCLRERATQMANYDPFKADIFAIGMIVL